MMERLKSTHIEQEGGRAGEDEDSGGGSGKGGRRRVFVRRGGGASNESRKGGHKSNVVVFPEKLHIALDRIEVDGLSSVVSWLPHGKSFKIHKEDEFASKVLPQYFWLLKASFQRQLNIYGFRRVRTGPDRGAVYHELFLKGRPELCRGMTRRLNVKENRLAEDRAKHEELRKARTGTASPSSSSSSAAVTSESVPSKGPAGKGENGGGATAAAAAAAAADRNSDEDVEMNGEGHDGDSDSGDKGAEKMKGLDRATAVATAAASVSQHPSLVVSAAPPVPQPASAFPATERAGPTGQTPHRQVHSYPRATVGPAAAAAATSTDVTLSPNFASRRRQLFPLLSSSSSASAATTATATDAHSHRDIGRVGAITLRSEELGLQHAAWGVTADGDAGADDSHAPGPGDAVVVAAARRDAVAAAVAAGIGTDYPIRQYHPRIQSPSHLSSLTSSSSAAAAAARHPPSSHSREGEEKGRGRGRGRGRGQEGGQEEEKEEEEGPVEQPVLPSLPLPRVAFPPGEVYPVRVRPSSFAVAYAGTTPHLHTHAPPHRRHSPSSAAAASAAVSGYGGGGGGATDPRFVDSIDELRQSYRYALPEGATTTTTAAAAAAVAAASVAAAEEDGVQKIRSGAGWEDVSAPPRSFRPGGGRVPPPPPLPPPPSRRAQPSEEEVFVVVGGGVGGIGLEERGFVVRGIGGPGLRTACPPSTTATAATAMTAATEVMGPAQLPEYYADEPVPGVIVGRRSGVPSSSLSGSAYYRPQYAFPRRPLHHRHFYHHHHHHHHDPRLAPHAHQPRHPHDLYGDPYGDQYYDADELMAEMYDPTTGEVILVPYEDVYHLRMRHDHRRQYSVRHRHLPGERFEGEALQPHNPPPPPPPTLDAAEHRPAAADAQPNHPPPGSGGASASGAAERTPPPRAPPPGAGWGASQPHPPSLTFTSDITSLPPALYEHGYRRAVMDSRSGRPQPDSADGSANGAVKASVPSPPSLPQRPGEETGPTRRITAGGGASYSNGEGVVPTSGVGGDRVTPVGDGSSRVAYTGGTKIAAPSSPRRGTAPRVAVGTRIGAANVESGGGDHLFPSRLQLFYGDGRPVDDTVLGGEEDGRRGGSNRPQLFLRDGRPMDDAMLLLLLGRNLR